MGQLVVFLPRLRLENGVAACLLAFRVGRRDEANFVVENADQVIEVPGTTSVARCFQQFGVGPHVALDVAAGFRQQDFQDRHGLLSGGSGVPEEPWLH